MKITQTRSFQVATALHQPVEVLFLNRMGGWCTLQLTKFRTSGLDTERHTYATSQRQRTFKVEATDKVTYYSPYLSPSDYDWLRDLALSPFVMVGGAYVNVIELKGFELDNFNDIWSFEMTVSPEREENKITL